MFCCIPFVHGCCEALFCGTALAGCCCLGAAAGSACGNRKQQQPVYVYRQGGGGSSSSGPADYDVGTGMPVRKAE